MIVCQLRGRSTELLWAVCIVCILQLHPVITTLVCLQAVLTSDLVCSYSFRFLWLYFLCICWQLATAGILFSGCPWVHACMTINYSLWTRYLKNQQIYNFDVPWHKDKLTSFWGQEVKGQRHNATKRARKLVCEHSAVDSRYIELG